MLVVVVRGRGSSMERWKNSKRKDGNGGCEYSRMVVVVVVIYLLRFCEGKTREKTRRRFHGPIRIKINDLNHTVE